MAIAPARPAPDTPDTLDAAGAYRARFLRVLDYIDAHLDEPLTVERLSGVAAFSKFHFHRQFTELFGMGVFEYVQLTRLKRASYHLAFRADRAIVDIALGSGYDSHEAFSRAFKKRVGQTPSAFRKQPDWEPWHRTWRLFNLLRSRHMSSTVADRQVGIVQFPETAVAALAHRGDARRIGDTVRKFIEWRKAERLSPAVSATFNTFHDVPAGAAPGEVHLDICVSTSRPVAPNAFGVVGKTIPAGRCAVLRHVGSDEQLEARAAYLYREWLPASGEEPRDFPLFCQRVSFFPNVPEHEAVTDLFLPLA